MDITGLGAIFNMGSKIIDKFWPDKAEAERAKLELFKMQQAGELRELESSFNAIIAEAQSADPWTSRARPSFMYVMYIMILASLPMGLLFAFKPEIAMAVTAGVKSWLIAIPEELYALFGVGYVGYSVTRSYDKSKGGK
jgi:hypothetical protein